VFQLTRASERSSFIRDHYAAVCPTDPAFGGSLVRRETMAMMRWTCPLVLIAAVLCACGSSTVTPRPPKTVIYPPVPAGGTDCGVNNEMSGWPTTTVRTPADYSCLTDALGSGRPARFVQIKPGGVDSGRKTSDGYSIPAGIVITYRVFGPARLQVTTDRREAGGGVTTQNCTGLSQPTTVGSQPTASGCKSG
jgi:hypothetical protein